MPHALTIWALPTPTGAEPRQARGGIITLESGFDYETIRKLMQMGHKVGYGLGSYGGYQAIWHDTEKRVYYGVSESRKDGQATEY